MRNPGLGSWSIICAYRGSIAHGMYIPNSDPNSIDDKDIISICVPPQSYYYGLDQYGSRGTVEIKEGEWDIVIYEIRKLVSMLLSGNPNVLSLLWMNKEHYLSMTKEGEYLIQNRDIFVGKYVYASFVGYAMSQLKRITRYEFRGYMGSKRKALVETYGYDCKNAAHLIRLLRMAIEFLYAGQLNVVRYDADELLSIKKGEWLLDDVKSEADRLFELAKEAYVKSRLPDKPDREAANLLCTEIVRSVLS